MLSSHKKAFTIIELVFVLAIFAIAVGVGFLYAQTSQVRSDLNAQTAIIVSYLRLAQSDSSSGNNNGAHGVHLDTSSYTVFKSPSYSDSDPENFVVELPTTLSIESIALNGGGSDVIFDSPFGSTLTYGTFVLMSSRINSSKQITINSIGTIQY